MKKMLLSLFAVALGVSALAQTAREFTLPLTPDGAADVVQQGRLLQPLHRSVRLCYAQPNSLRKLRIGELLSCLIHKRGKNNDILSFNHGAYYIRE